MTKLEVSYNVFETETYFVADVNYQEESQVFQTCNGPGRYFASLIVRFLISHYAS